jgi:hypothetical protein
VKAVGLERWEVGKREEKEEGSRGGREANGAFACLHAGTPARSSRYGEERGKKESRAWESEQRDVRS